MIEYRKLAWGFEVGPDENKVRRLLSMSKEELANVPLSEVQRAVFGFDNMNDVIEVEPEEVSITKDSDYQLAQQDIEEEGTDAYDTRDLCIFDLKNGELSLNDGHHRYIVAMENGDTLKGYVQIVDDAYVELEKLRKKYQGAV